MYTNTGDAPGTPVVKPQRKSQTKGKWLKITRKGLLVSAISRMGKIKKLHQKPLNHIILFPFNRLMYSVIFAYKSHYKFD